MSTVLELSASAPQTVAATVVLNHVNSEEAAVNPLAVSVDVKTKRIKRGRSLDALGPSDDDDGDAVRRVAAVSKKMRGGRPPKVAVTVTGKKRGRKPNDCATVQSTVSSVVYCEVSTQTDHSVYQSVHEVETQTVSILSESTSVDVGLSEIVVKCIKALLMPVSDDVHFLHKEIEELKFVVAQLSSSVSDVAEAFNENPVSDLPSRLVWTDRSSPPHQQDASTHIITSSAAAGAATAANVPVCQVQHQPPYQPQRHQPTRAYRADSRHIDSQPVESKSDLKKDVMASMYIDMELKQRRSRNIIVSGLPYDEDDHKRITKLLSDEFHVDHITTTSCRRVGKRVEGRVQPLLVTLESRRDADYIITNAKRLRKSCDTRVRNSVFISADLTPAEAKAAYEMRCRRRERIERSGRSENAENQSSAPGRCFYRSTALTSAVGLAPSAGAAVNSPVSGFHSPAGETSSSVQSAGAGRH